MEDTLNQKTQPVKTQENSSSPMLSIVLVVVILGMAIYGYMNGNFDGISKKELQSNYTKNSDISFSLIASAEKQNYISKDKYLDKIDELKNVPPKTVEKVVEKIVEKIIYKDKIIEAKPKEVKVEKVIYKDKIIKSDPMIVEKLIEKTVYKDKIIDKSKFDVYKCYGMSPSGYRMSSKCTKGLKSFLKKNAEAKYFEVIAVMNPKDFRTLMILEQKTDLLSQIDLNEKQVSKLKELSSVGLDKLRVVETMWEVKKILGKQTIVVPVSYNVNSEKYRGTVLRAYK